MESLVHVNARLFQIKAKMVTVNALEVHSMQRGQQLHGLSYKEKETEFFILKTMSDPIKYHN